MAKKNEEKKVITKENWVSSFSLIGKPKISDYTFKINETSEKSDWIYNSLNLGIDCGERFGTVYCEMMGGYSASKKNTIFAHGKNDDGTDNFKAKVEIDWDDRLNDKILDDVGNSCFITVGLEKTDKDKNYRRRFLSAYDAIKYIKECLTTDMVVNVYGTLKYSMYQDKVQVRKTINRIELYNAEPDKFCATFKQSVLLDQDSVNLKNVDTDKGIMYVDARVLDYIKEYNGIEVRGQFPFMKTFEYDVKNYTKDQFKLVVEKLLKVKKNITQINFNGLLIEGGAVAPASIDELPDDVREMVQIGAIPLEEAIKQCTANGKRELRMILTSPDIRKSDDGVPSVQKFEERYTDDDLHLDYLYTDDASEMDDNSDSNPAPVAAPAEGDLSWMKELLG